MGKICILNFCHLFKRRFEMNPFSLKLRLSTLKPYVLIIILSICIIPSVGFAQRDNRYAKEIRTIEDTVEKELKDSNSLL